MMGSFRKITVISRRGPSVGQAFQPDNCMTSGWKAYDSAAACSHTPRGGVGGTAAGATGSMVCKRSAMLRARAVRRLRFLLPFLRAALAGLLAGVTDGVQPRVRCAARASD